MKRTMESKLNATVFYLFSQSPLSLHPEEGAGLDYSYGSAHLKALHL